MLIRRAKMIDTHEDCHSKYNGMGGLTLTTGLLASVEVLRDNMSFEGGLVMLCVASALDMGPYAEDIIVENFIGFKDTAFDAYKYLKGHLKLKIRHGGYNDA